MASGRVPIMHRIFFRGWLNIETAASINVKALQEAIFKVGNRR